MPIRWTGSQLNQIDDDPELVVDAGYDREEENEPATE